MGQIGTMITGAGVVTPLVGQTSCPQSIYLGDVDTANPLQGLQVEVDGQPFINIINNASLVNAYAKWLQEPLAGGTNGLLLPIATGKIEKNTTLRLTNNGATVPVIRAFSEEGEGVPLIVATTGINALSGQDFINFSGLIIDLPANVNNIEIVTTDGHRETWTVQDADAYYNKYHASETDGRLGGCTVIDNRDGKFASVRINTVTALTVLIAKLPDGAFNALRNA